jgi:hypothetical protein
MSSIYRDSTQRMLPDLVITIFTSSRARERAVRLAARVVRGALPCTGIGRELSGPGWQAGAMRPRGTSPLPVRPLRLRPVTATAGGRARVTPGTGLHQVAAVTPTGHGPAPGSAPSPASWHEVTKVHSGLPVRRPIPGADHCVSRPEPVKGA